MVNTGYSISFTLCCTERKIKGLSPLSLYLLLIYWYIYMYTLLCVWFKQVHFCLFITVASSVTWCLVEWHEEPSCSAQAVFFIWVCPEDNQDLLEGDFYLLTMVSYFRRFCAKYTLVMLLHPFTLKIYFVYTSILLTVCHTVLTNLAWRI